MGTRGFVRSRPNSPLAVFCLPVKLMKEGRIAPFVLGFGRCTF